MATFRASLLHIVASWAIHSQLACLVQELSTHQALARRVGDVLEEDGKVREGASEELRRARARIRGLEQRVGGMLKGLPGQVTEHVRNPSPLPKVLLCPSSRTWLSFCLQGLGQ